MLTTREYIKIILKAKLPNLDVSDNSPLSELFVNPAAAMMDPLLTQLKYLLDNLGLKDPEKINPDELDAIGSNFLVYRRQAIPSTGYVEMFYDIAQNISIPIGTTFTALDSRIYATTKTFTISEGTMNANLWRFPLYSTGLIPVVATYDTLGTPLDPNSITSTDFAIEPSQITNPVAFAAGILAETNTEYAERLINAVMNRSLASEQSFNNLITENFPSVYETVVIGAGDDRMVRDLHYSGVESLENYYLVDYRGKISVTDFYISASGGYYIRTSGLFDSVPSFDEYPYTQSKAYWTLFYDDPTTSGLVPDMPIPDEYITQFTTAQYANIYYLKDAYKTTLQTTLLLQDPFVGGALDPKWIAGDAYVGTSSLWNAYEIAATDDGVRLGYIPAAAVLEQTPIPVSKRFMTLIKNVINLALTQNPSYASMIDQNALSTNLLDALGIENKFTED